MFACQETWIWENKNYYEIAMQRYISDDFRTNQSVANAGNFIGIVQHTDVHLTATSCVQVIRDVRERGFVCAPGDDSQPDCTEAYNAVVCIFDSMHTMARTAIAAKASGRELVVIVDECHEIVQAKK